MQSPTVTVWPAVQESKELGVFEGEGVDTCQHCALPLGPLSDWEKPYPPWSPREWASLSGHPAVTDPGLQLFVL